MSDEASRTELDDEEGTDSCFLELREWLLVVESRQRGEQLVMGGWYFSLPRGFVRKHDLCCVCPKKHCQIKQSSSAEWPKLKWL
ncbi:hypothetical protein OIU77_019999 [Salix suchowensis]|uniref:Uncharacterized protein n=1 Tax=Salix suchowensis TaxID=1278906 RepID=A0ABQ9CIZ4_9ROSI|nr:hypothetical protein OIU77_019999 [Salix suchowensis]